ncbi:MAG: hypothetical protein FWC91_09785 [Defluviitaleaceae bacterium]|nr:hypothetical protein [Defluviitaleaceae bacterium]
MIYDIPMPEISPDFTIKDIHAIREWNYERLKDATEDERISDIKRRAREAKKQMDTMRHTSVK